MLVPLRVIKPLTPCYFRCSNPAAHGDVTGPLVNPFLITNLDRVSRVRVSLRYQEFSVTSRHTSKCIAGKDGGEWA
jgi:hypothetical protein